VQAVVGGGVEGAVVAVGVEVEFLDFEIASWLEVS